MPRDGSLTPTDLVGKLNVLRVECSKCPGRGRYRVERLALDLGWDGKLTDWLAEVAAGCPRKLANSYSDACGVHCPDLSKVL